MPRATTKLPPLFDTTNEMAQKTSVSLSEGHLHDFAQGLFGIEELGGGKYCATATHCSEGFGTKTLNNCRGMIVFATLRQPLTRSNSRKQRSRGRVASETKTCCPLEASLEASPGPHARLQKVGKNFVGDSGTRRAPYIITFYLASILASIMASYLIFFLAYARGPCVPSRIGSSP